MAAGAGLALSRGARDAGRGCGQDGRAAVASSHPGMLANDLAGYLFARTTGHIGSLMTLVNRGARRAIRRGGETLTGELLDTVKIDKAAEQARAQLQAALSAGRLNVRPRSLRAPAAAGAS